jgi:hypothetical protein
MRFQIKHKVRKGQKFGKWKVIGVAFTLKIEGKQPMRQVEVKCECGYKCCRRITDLIRGRTKMCQKCSKKSKFRTSYRGVGELSGAHVTAIRGRLVRKSKTLIFDITKEYLWELYLKQDKKCALSGVEIIMNPNRKLSTASLDRIESDKDYVENNVQWVHKIVNKMKMELSDQEFIKWCKLIANHEKGKTV